VTVPYFHAGGLGAGTLTIAQAGTIRAQGAVTVSNAVALNNNVTIGGTDPLTMTGTMTLSAARTITNSNTTSTTTFAAVNGATYGLTFSGNGNTTVTGVIGTTTGGLTKNGTGTLTLTNAASTYTGVTSIAAGTLSASKLANGSATSSIGTSTNVAANLLIGPGATLQYTGTGDTTDRFFTLNGGTTSSSTHTLDASGSGAINFNNVGSLAYGTAAKLRTLKLIGSNTGNNTLAATLANNTTAALSVVKDGAGKWILTGASAYTGATNVNAGGSGDIELNWLGYSGGHVPISGISGPPILLFPPPAAFSSFGFRPSSFIPHSGFRFRHFPPTPPLHFRRPPTVPALPARLSPPHRGGMPPTFSRRRYADGDIPARQGNIKRPGRHHARSNLACDGRLW